MADMRLIDANAIFANGAIYVKKYDGFTTAHMILDAIDSAPTIDAVPVVHGRWVDEETERYVCTVCGKWFFIDCGDGNMNYCPNCGAKMDETNPE